MTPARPPNAPVELMAAPIAGGPPRLIMKEPGINNIACAQSTSRRCILNIFLGQSNLFYLFDLQHGKGRLVAKLSSFADWGSLRTAPCWLCIRVCLPCLVYLNVT